MKPLHWYTGIIMVCLSILYPDEIKTFVHYLIHNDNTPYVLGIILIILMIIGMCKIISDKKDNNKKNDN